MSAHQVSVIRRNAQFSAIAENCWPEGLCHLLADGGRMCNSRASAGTWRHDVPLPPRLTPPALSRYETCRLCAGGSWGLPGISPSCWSMASQA
jgi:hypothetical protein